MRGRSWEMMESAQNRRRRQGVGDDNMLNRSSLTRVRVFVWSLCEICPRAALRDDQWVLGEFQTSVDPYSFEGRGSPPLAGLLGSRVPVVTHLVLFLRSGSSGRGAFCFASKVSAMPASTLRRGREAAPHKSCLVDGFRWRPVPGEAVRSVLMAWMGC
jgi:hypothetical protein